LKFKNENGDFDNLGFYTTDIVMVENEKDAEYAAVALIKTDKELILQVVAPGKNIRWSRNFPVSKSLRQSGSSIYSNNRKFCDQTRTALI
jgi:hypothetical protein